MLNTFFAFSNTIKKMLQTISSHYPQISAAVQFNGENIFGAPKMQNNFWYLIKMLNFPILQLLLPI